MKISLEASLFGEHFKIVNEILTPKLQPKQNTWKMSKIPQLNTARFRLKYYIKR